MKNATEENYLKTIFHLEQSNPKGVSTNSLAEKLETKPSSVSEMLKKLSSRKLLIYRKYQGVRLTERGRAKALEVVRKHRLWEYFLVEKLNFSWSEVHEVAEQLEHIESFKLIDELDAFLGQPKKDPHGDPIPDSSGNFEGVQGVPLAELRKGDKGFCTAVGDASADFLGYLDKRNIGLGKELEVIDREVFDQSLLVRIEGEEWNISALSAGNIFVELEPKK